MRSDAFAALCERRAARARSLAGRFPATAEVLQFYGVVATLQGRPDLARESIVALVLEHGPELLRGAAASLDDRTFSQALDAYRSGADRTSPTSFFARVLLQRESACADAGELAGVAPRDQESASACPRCGHPPQVAVRLAEGDGTTVRLSCSLCFEEWPSQRGRCVRCEESGSSSLAYWSAPELPHLSVQACDACGVYIHHVDRAAEPASVPDVDEVAALPLDVWARERGYRKVTTNLVGM